MGNREIILLHPKTARPIICGVSFYRNALEGGGMGLRPISVFSHCLAGIEPANPDCLPSSSDRERLASQLTSETE